MHMLLDGRKCTWRNATILEGSWHFASQTCHLHVILISVRKQAIMDQFSKKQCLHMYGLFFHFPHIFEHRFIILETQIILIFLMVLWNPNQWDFTVYPYDEFRWCLWTLGLHNTSKNACHTVESVLDIPRTRCSKIMTHIPENTDLGAQLLFHSRRSSAHGNAWTEIDCRSCNKWPVNVKTLARKTVQWHYVDVPKPPDYVIYEAHHCGFLLSLWLSELSLLSDVHHISCQLQLLVSH